MDVQTVERALAKFSHRDGPEAFEEEYPEHPGRGGYEIDWCSLSYRFDTSDGVYVPDLGLVKQVSRYGGEGQGDDLWFIIHVEGTGMHYRKSGYWVSHDGAYWDGAFEEVTPRQKTITVWD